MATSLQCPRPGAQIVDEGPFLGARLDYSVAPAKDGSAVRAIAEILTRPCFSPWLCRVSWENYTGRQTGHVDTSAAVIESYLRNSRCETLILDSGRHKELIAIVTMMTGWFDDREDGEGLIPAAPFIMDVILPYDEQIHVARLQALRELARALRAVTGVISVEPTFDLASRVAMGQSPPTPLERALAQIGMTQRRVRERDGYSVIFQTLDREISGPEWGLFLSREHLERLPVERIEKSGVFARVERLADDLAYLQITEEPLDTLREDYDSMLDRARDVLAPILMEIPYRGMFR